MVKYLNADEDLSLNGEFSHIVYYFVILKVRSM